jgi:uncharacterized protein
MLRLGKNIESGVKVILLTALLSYFSACLVLFVQQRHLIFNPSTKLVDLPSAKDYRLPYQTIWIPIPRSQSRLHAWWIPAPNHQEHFTVLPNEPAKLASAKVLLYFGGRGSNKSYHLPRIAGLRQIGFSILMIDYRGYGQSAGDLPSEVQLYEDSQAAWTYLTHDRKIAPAQIMIYGESLGGAVALDLAVKQPTARGVILQSTFTSMADIAKHTSWMQWFPIDLLLTERFNSLAKMRSLQIPVLILHGETDPVVPSYMGQLLYDAAPTPKRLLLIPGKGHFSIYQAGPYSYLRAIEQFLDQELSDPLLRNES